MFNEKLAVAIKSAGKVLRENKDQVYLPFGSEYSILVKNLNSVRALVKISIDGKNVNDAHGGEFVVGPNSSMELERFISNGNMDMGNRFKFIERSASVENHRGIGIEDGLVRIEFQFERPITIDPIYWPVVSPAGGADPFTVYRNVSPTWVSDQPLTGNPTFQPSYTVASNSASKSMFAPAPNASDVFTYTANTSDTLTYTANASNVSLSQSISDVGITVPGSLSNQRFAVVGSFPVEFQTHVIVLHLMGETEGKKVKTAVDVKHKPKCTTCGKVNKATAKFCTNCGTSLVLV